MIDVAREGVINQATFAAFMRASAPVTTLIQLRGRLHRDDLGRRYAECDLVIQLRAQNEATVLHT